MGHAVDPGHDLHDGERKDFFTDAAAAIAAMRGPTEAMLVAACKAAEAEQARPIAIRRTDVVTVFDAAVDAALTEKE